MIAKCTLAKEAKKAIERDGKDWITPREVAVEYDLSIGRVHQLLENTPRYSIAGEYFFERSDVKRRMDRRSHTRWPVDPRAPKAPRKRWDETGY